MGPLTCLMCKRAPMTHSAYCKPCLMLCLDGFVTEYIEHVNGDDCSSETEASGSSYCCASYEDPDYEPSSETTDCSLEYNSDASESTSYEEDST